MKNLKFLFLSLIPAAVFAVGTVNNTDPQDEQLVTINVNSVNQLDISGDVSFTILAPGSAGSDLDSGAAYTDSSSTLSLTTNELNRRVTVAADAIPQGVVLKLTTDVSSYIVNSTAVGVDADSSAQITLSTSAQNLITNIQRAVINDVPLQFELEVAADAGTSTKEIILTYLLTSI